ncbi:hypothetical protein HNQ50_001338 [Silvimonas terrae]|uniref:Uncharacterized protein n=1 Tax=Silvimonas terrae TaxID=300266 RepID=A0A840RDV4_9NEIS|nr:twin-arginine translocation signal domain-containing protein [Silvimonas terrae]MBB5190616.1 hypothetical protein [Silvimonas terrae]
MNRPDQPADPTRRNLLKASAALASLGVPGTALAVDSTSASAPAPTRPTRFVINGHRMDATVDTRTTLLDLLREHLHLTGTKKAVITASAGPARCWSMAGASIAV